MRHIKDATNHPPIIILLINTSNNNNNNNNDNDIDNNNNNINLIIAITTIIVHILLSSITCAFFSNTKGLEPLRLEEELDIHHLETLMFKFMTHIPDKIALKKWLTRRGSVYRDHTRHSAGLMTQEEFHEMLADLLGVETWDSQKVALFEKEIGMLFKKVTYLGLLNIM